jgi:hypothetical protein
MTRSLTSNWFDCARLGSDLLRCVKKKEDWVTVTSTLCLSLLPAAVTTTEQYLSRCPCCWSCNVITTISDWNVLLPKSLICLGKTFPIPSTLALFTWHVCIACMWPKTYSHGTRITRERWLCNYYDDSDGNRFFQTHVIFSNKLTVMKVLVLGAKIQYCNMSRWWGHTDNSSF